MRVFIISSILLVICMCGPVAEADDKSPPQTIYLPKSMRAEGRITLTYTDGSETTTHHLAFTELIDDERKRSKISIGYISYQQAEYQTRSGQTMTLDETGKCKVITTRSFVPELDWFVRMMYTDEEIKSFLDLMPQQVGPSGLLWKLMLWNRDDKNKITSNYEGKVSHRNLDCHLSSFKYGRAKCKAVKFEMYLPVKNFFTETRVPMFSVKETAPIESAEGDTTAKKYGTTFLVDYFNIENTESMNPHQLEQMEMEFNLPLARGCSQFLPQTHPYGWNIGHSFMMQYYQRLAMTHVIVAYDNQFNYFRKEFFERSVSVWDLNEELMYHSDSMGLERLRDAGGETSADVTPCSVLNVEDDKLGPSVRPYNHTGSSIVMIDLLGAYNLAFVGRGRVRQLPCAIYETILAEPPNIFALNTETPARTGKQYEYIVQFHLLRADANSADYTTPEGSKLDENFWPARIVLYKRHKSNGGQAELLDQLEVYDFHRGLIGWDKKASELFMAPECFEDEDEQVTLELDIQFDKYHLDAERRLIAHNKFKLENDLVNEISSLFHISRLHVTEFELSLRPHNVLMSLVISDRKEEKKLVYFGAGQLPNEDSYLNNRIVMKGLGEQTCVSLASLIKEISLVVHCPNQDLAQSTCTAVYGESAPTIKLTPAKAVDDKAAPVDKSLSQCQVYRFNVDSPPKPATSNWQEWRQLLEGYKFKFSAVRPDQQEIVFNGLIQDFDLERQLQLMSISHYMYSVDYVTKAHQDKNNHKGEKTNHTTNLIRSFGSISYHNVGDCAKICDLDVDCRSYSYCVQSGVCLVSSLDIRASNVDQQLVSLTPSADNKVLVNGVEATGMINQYELDLASGCNIYERDYLGMYTETDEVISLAAKVASQFHSKESAFRCAQWSVDVERGQPDQHHVAMFAYCPSTKSCLLDENLFAEQLNTTTSSGGLNNQQAGAGASDEWQVHCQVYRRKYQTYFELSTEVVRRNKMYQLELNFNTVEECARSCWNRFGQICASFDFCSPRDCIINIIPNEADPKVVDEMTNNREVRRDCLHYERDLRLDHLRQEHLIGGHQVLVPFSDKTTVDDGQTSRGWPLVLNVVLFSLLSASFVVGLAVGHRVNERLEKVTIRALRQSFSAGPGNLARRASQALGSSFNFSRFNSAHSPFVSSTSSYDNHTNEDDFIGHSSDTADGFEKVLIDGSSAIQMEEIKRQNVTIEEEDEEEDDNDDKEQDVDDDDDDDDGGGETSPDDIQSETKTNTNSSADQSNDNEVPNLLQL